MSSETETDGLAKDIQASIDDLDQEKNQPSQQQQQQQQQHEVDDVDKSHPSSTSKESQQIEIPDSVIDEELSKLGVNPATSNQSDSEAAAKEAADAVLAVEEHLKHVLATNTSVEKSNFILKDKEFYIINKSNKNEEEIDSIIENLGGKVVEYKTDNSIALAKPATALPNDINYDVYSFNYVYSAQKENLEPNLESFKIKKNSQLPTNLSIDYGAYADTLANEKSTDAAESTLPPPPPPTDTIDGTPLAPSANSVPKKKSAKFNDIEDSAILELVRRNPNLRSTHSFFAKIAELPVLSGHTGNSIRFRFRKILSDKLDWVYDIDPKTNQPRIDENGNPIKIKELPNLIKSQYTSEEDYSLCKQVLHFKENVTDYQRKRKMDNTSVPESVFASLVEKNPRHTAMSWRDRYRKFASRYGLQEYINYYEACKANGEEPQPMKNLSSRVRNGSGKGTERKSKRLRTTSSSDKDLSLPVDATNLERIQELARVSVERKEEDGVDKQDKDKNDKNKDDVTAGANLFMDANEDEIKALNMDLENILDPETLIPYEALLKLEPHPIKNRPIDPNIVEEKSRDVTEILNKFGSTFTTTYDLFKTVNESTGISMRWLGYWFDCSCGHLNVFLVAILNYIRTGELILEEFPGFWTDKHDTMLKNDSNSEDLLKLHGLESVTKRKEALFGSPNNE